MKRAAMMLSVALLSQMAGQAHAWETETTHAGLAEQAALSSRLHKRLVDIGFSGGLFELLTIPPADAPVLIENLHLLSPSQGSVPDARGRQTALAWIAAGAALADIPSRHAANHFYDPSLRTGWSEPDRGVFEGLSDSIREAIGRASLPAHGVPAPQWITSKDNPFNLSQFLDQYGKAASAATPGERSRHMAAALVAAGGILHVLADMGSPSRVRGDEQAHFSPLGGGPDDLGSRFERIAALAFGRLGVPAPSRVITRNSMLEYFSSADGGGLADEIARGYFSPNTLPSPTRVSGEPHPHLVRPQPALPARLNLMAASRDDGTTLRDKNGTCLARYKVEHSVVSFNIDDECMLDQVTAILPEVAAYETGLLDYLLRGELTITSSGGQLAFTAENLGGGDVDVLVEDASGVRKSVGTFQAAGGRDLGKIAMPSEGVRVIAVFRGADAKGEPLVAVGAMPLSH